MARTDAIVLGAGIVGTTIALHLAKRGLAVALVDRREPGEETSYGNTRIIEGNTIFPAAFPRSLAALARVALKRAPEANYHVTFLPKVAPWLLAFRAWSQPDKLVETARAMRPLFGRAVAEHEALMAETGAAHLRRTTGWLKLYRRIILPPIVLACMPVLGNQMIQIIKDSAFLTIIAVPELTHAASAIQSAVIQLKVLNV